MAFILSEQSGDDIIDVRNIIERVEELKGIIPETAHDVTPGDAVEAAKAQEELATLESILADLAGNGGDEQWRGDWYPVTLIRDSYFTDYARELVEDCYSLDGIPSFVEVDWNATARNVQIDYTMTEIEGVDYWYR